MPIYEFECKKCSNITTAISTIGTKTHPCTTCSGVATKVVSLSSFSIKGFSEANGYSNSKDCSKSKDG